LGNSKQPIAPVNRTGLISRLIASGRVGITRTMIEKLHGAFSSFNGGTVRFQSVSEWLRVDRCRHFELMQLWSGQKEFCDPRNRVSSQELPFEASSRIQKPGFS
jgi:hypothetical protein